MSQGIAEKKQTMADPGPGKYDPPLKDTKKEFKSTEQNYQFTKNELDRFGDLTIRYAALNNIPGPGNYDLDPDKNNKFKTQAIFDNNVNKGFET